MSAASGAAPARSLSRAALAAVDSSRRHTPPARIVHIGLGGFHRAHQAWYTDRAADAAEWGIAAFTGRSPQAAVALAAQEGLFTLIERAADGDSASVIASIVEAADGANVERLLNLVAAPSTALATLTVTEAGYRLDPSGRPRADDPLVLADLQCIAAACGHDDLLAESGRPQTALGRLLLGLEARRRAAGGPIAIVPCDNVPANGAFASSGLVAMASAVGGELAAWVVDNVSFVSTAVDRITPKTMPVDCAIAATLTGWEDHAPIVTEPYREWVLAGEFPAGRPAWESAGAHFVSDVEPFERRKLWLLNGGHSLLAYTGLRAGHATVAQALADRACLRFVNDFWDEAARHLVDAQLDLAGYRAGLLERFANPRISYPLAQIATDGVAKLGVRVAPVVLAERAAGRDAGASTLPLAAWVALVLAGREFVDTAADSVDAARGLPQDEAIATLISLVAPRLCADDPVMRRIAQLVSEGAAPRMA